MFSFIELTSLSATCGNNYALHMNVNNLLVCIALHSTCGKNIVVLMVWMF